MIYYILKETFNPPYDTYIVSELIDYPELQKEIEAGSPNYTMTDAKTFYYRGEEPKDFMHSDSFVIVSEKFINALSSLNTNAQFHYYPIHLAHQNTQKTSKHYILGLPSISFFDYEKSDYVGIQEESLIVRINKLIIDKSKLVDHFIVRFQELTIDILVNESAKKLLEQAEINGLAYVHTDSFVCPTFP